MGDVRGWIRKGAGRSYRDFKWVSSLVQIMWSVIFTCHSWLSAVSWPSWMANSECEIALQQIGLHLLLSVQLISQWQHRAGEHKSYILSCRYGTLRYLNSNCFSLILLWFWATHTDMQTHTHTVLAQMSFHIWLPGALVLALKTPITSVKYYGWLYWSFSAIMQSGHEWWVNMNCAGKGRSRSWGPFIKLYSIIHIFVRTLHKWTHS